LYFSDAKAVLNASASRSRRVASDCAIAILASFSPLIATALASDVLHEYLFELPLYQYFIFKSSSTYLLSY
jgi:hypothetical protein